MNEIVPVRPCAIGAELVPAVDSRDLHVGLGIRTNHRDWIRRRVLLANLREGFDFEAALNSERCSEKGGEAEVVYVLSLDAAKHIAMMERTEIAFRIRCYFIEKEKEARAATTLDLAAVQALVRSQVNALVAEALHANFSLLRTEIRSAETWTLEEWARRRRVTLTAKQARAIGGALATICRGANLPMGRQASEYRRGTPPRTYPRTVLELHFARLVERHSPTPQLRLLQAATPEVVS